MTLNANGILWARHVISHDPAGMVVKNFAFLILAWVGASLASRENENGESTPWQHGRFDAREGRSKVLFGRMYEDAAIEFDKPSGSGRARRVHRLGWVHRDGARGAP